MKEKMQPVPGSATESLRTPFTASPLLSESLEQAKKNAASSFSLKKVHPQGTRDSAEGIRTNYRWARVYKQTGRFPAGYLIQPKQLQEHLILQLLFFTGIFLGNELRATLLSISCVLKRRFLVTNRLFYDACSAEKSKDLICPQESISFDQIGFYNTFCFSSLRSRDFVPEEMADILGNHCTGCLGCLGGNGQHSWLDINLLLEAII